MTSDDRILVERVIEAFEGLAAVVGLLVLGGIAIAAIVAGGTAGWAVGGAFFALFAICLANMLWRRKSNSRT